MVYTHFDSFICSSILKARVYTCEDTCFHNYIKWRTQVRNFMCFDLGPLCMYSKPNLFVSHCIAHLLEVTMATHVHCGIVTLLIYCCACMAICKRLHLSVCLTLLLPRFCLIHTGLQFWFSQFWKIIVTLIYSLCLVSVIYVMIKTIRIKKDRKMMSPLE